MKLVFLHGIGDGDAKHTWLDGLNRGLTATGFDQLRAEQVIAPRYSALLTTDGISAKLPPLTFRQKEDLRARREFERNQARIQRMLGDKHSAARVFGFNLFPEPAVNAMAGIAVEKPPIADLHQVRRYVGSEGLRGAVMRSILDHVPAYGDIVLVAHSLGSVIAIDLLDHLPEDLRVARFITIGSPANLKALHEGSDRLLKRFPYGRVDAWSNFLDTGDPVTGGRGLASLFPGAQDFEIDTNRSHAAGNYLANTAVARVIGEPLFPGREVATIRSNVAVRMDDMTAKAILAMHFARAVAREITDKDRADRYRDALKLQQDDLSHALRIATAGRIPAPEVAELANGQLPALPHRWEADKAVHELVVLALANLVEPYEIDVDRAPLKALPHIAVELGFTRTFGAKIGEALSEVQEVVGRRGGIRWGKVITAAAGIALLSAGPIGLAVAAPAGLAGAAAITSGLAAFGPGGMVGGLAMLGGLASGGAAVAAGAAASGADAESGKQTTTRLIIRVVVEYTRKTLDYRIDDSVWRLLADYETQVSAELNRLSAFSDKNSPKTKDLKDAQHVVKRLMEFVLDKGLAPRAIERGRAADAKSEGVRRAQLSARSAAEIER